MRPFSGEDAHTTLLFSSSSSSSSTYTNTSSSSSPSPCPFSPSKTSMEEVWKDINLSSLHHHSSTSATVAVAAGIHLQDFLARPFAKEQQYLPPPSALHPTPDTMLNLNNSVVPDLHFLVQPPRGHGSSSFQFEALASASAGLDANAGLARNRFVNSDENSGDRRHKRMIKNRESAARSRARKQAYTNQLEQEVSQLVEENCRLKKHLQQLCVAAAAGGGGGGVPQLKNKAKGKGKDKGGSLYRTSTAPF